MKFLLTPELGRLAKWLRAIGHDAALFEGTLPDLLAKATVEKRTVLSRQKALQGHKGTSVIWIQNDLLPKQLSELIKACPIRSLQKGLFTRCLLCNVPVEAIAKEEVKDKVPPYVFQTQKDFSYCPSCQRIYWAATHWQRARNFLQRL